MSFAKLGYSRHHMREANERLLKHLGPSLLRDVAPDENEYRRDWAKAQKEAVGYLIENLDRQNMRENGLLPVVIVDDALTNERLLTIGAGLIVKARLVSYSQEGDHE